MTKTLQHRHVVNPTINEINVNVAILAELRAKGFPVTGSVSITGVTNGKLTMSTERSQIRDRVETVFEWVGEAAVGIPVTEDDEL